MINAYQDPKTKLEAAKRRLATLDKKRAVLLDLIGKLGKTVQRVSEVPLDAVTTRVDAKSLPLVANASSQADKIALFRSFFRGRKDVYALRFESLRTGKSGYPRPPSSASADVRRTVRDGDRSGRWRFIEVEWLSGRRRSRSDNSGLDPVVTSIVAPALNSNQEKCWRSLCSLIVSKRVIVRKTKKRRLEVSVYPRLTATDFGKNSLGDGRLRQSQRASGSGGQMPDRPELVAEKILEAAQKEPAEQYREG